MNAPLAIIDEQTVARRAWIGGSDVAGILKISPNSTPLEVYLWKIGEPTREMIEKINEPKTQRLFRRGKREEPNVVDDLAEDYGVKVVKRSTPKAPNRYTDPEHDFLRAEIDFEFEVTPELVGLVSDEHPEIEDALRKLVGTVQNGEVKTHHMWRRGFFGDVGTDQCPIEFTAQAMHGLMVTGRQITMFGVRSTLDDLRVYWIVRNDDTIKVMRPALVKFWRENVIARVEPDPIRLPDVEKLFLRRDTILVEASGEAVQWLADLEAARAQQRIGKEAEEEAKFQLGKFMLGDRAIVRPVGPRGGKYPVEPTADAPKMPHTLTVGTESVLEVSLRQQTRIDNEKVQKEYPDVARACAYDIRFFKFGKPPKPKARKHKR